MPKHIFEWENGRGKPLEIITAQTSCEDLQILSCSETVAPGAIARLEVRVVPSMIGSISCEVRVATSGPDAMADLVFHVEAEVESAPDAHLGKKPDLPPGLLLRKLRGTKPGTRITVPEVIAAREQNQDIILVDVRRAEEFDKFWVPGALNIPLYLVKTKVFLKSRPVVLLNEGCAYAQLEEEQKRLAGLGFERVSILEGGLNAWRRAGAPLAGDPFEIRKVAEISPKSYFLDRHFTHWIAIDASPEPNPESPFYIPEAVPVPYSGDDDAFLGQIHLQTDKVDDGLLPHVLIFDESGERYEKTLRLTKDADIGNLYYLQGGLPAYKLFLQQQVLLRHPRKMKSGSEVCQTCP